MKATGIEVKAKQVDEAAPDCTLTDASSNPVLSDSGLKASTGFGVAFELQPELIELYGKVGSDFPVLNGNGQWILPVPATFVIDQLGVIRSAHIEEDYRERAEPADVLKFATNLGMIITALAGNISQPKSIRS